MPLSRAILLRRTALLFSCLLFFLIGRCAAASAAAHPEMLVSTEWLAGHLNDPKMVVLQAGEERGRYDKEHIPGARFLNDADYVIGHQGLMVELPPVEKLKQTFEDLGISD